LPIDQSSAQKAKNRLGDGGFLSDQFPEGPAVDRQKFCLDECFDRGVARLFCHQPDLAEKIALLEDGQLSAPNALGDRDHGAIDDGIQTIRSLPLPE
jgi:hypothetical protein